MPAKKAKPPKPPKPPKGKKPKWVLLVSIAALVLITGLIGTFLFLRARNAPDHVVDQFLEAMDAGDFESLAAVSRLPGETEDLTEADVSPMFRLYEDDHSFQRTLEDLLEDELDRVESGEDAPQTDALAHLEPSGGSLFPNYQVVLQPCTVELSSDLACNVEAGGRTVQLSAASGEPLPADFANCSPDFEALAARTAKGELRGLLPGIYDLTATASNSIGQVFTSSTELTVTEAKGSPVMIHFSYEAPVIFNDGPLPVDLYVDGEHAGTAPAHSFYASGPFETGTTLEARAELEDTGPLSRSFPASEGISLCYAVVNNTSSAAVDLYVDGTAQDPLPASSSRLVALDHGGSTVEARLETSLAGTVSQSFHGNDNGGELTVTFELCELEVENSYQAPLHVSCNGKEIAVVPGEGSVSLSELPAGTELSIQLFGQDVTEPYLHLCQSGSEQIAPSGFELTQRHKAALDQAVANYIRNAIAIYDRRDQSGLSALTETKLSRDLLSDLKEEMAHTFDRDGYTYIFQIYPDTPEQTSSSLGTHADDEAVVDVKYRIPFDYTETYHYEDGQTEEDRDSHVIENDFTVRYNGSKWEVIGSLSST